MERHLPLADQLICPLCRATYPAGKRQCAQDRAALVPNLVGRRIAGRLITDVLGIGDVSAVYRARHHALGREEVLKVLRETIDLEHTARRMPILSSLRDPHTVRIFDYVPPVSARAIELDHGLIFSEMVEGRPLSTRPLGTQIGVSASAQIISQICASLAEAHQAGIAHGNLKPSNVVLVDSEVGVSVRVLDYGLVPTLETGAELADLRPGGRPLYGHAAYLAPECILRDASADARTDIYALGLMFYELLSGENPMRRGTTSSILRRQVEHEPPPVTGRDPLPEELVALITAMIAKQPELRPTNVGEVQRALAGLDLKGVKLKPGTARRTITGTHAQLGEQFAEAYTEVVDEREIMKAEIERERTRAAQAERRAQRWRTLAVMAFTLAAASSIMAVFALLQTPQGPADSPTTRAPRSAASAVTRSPRSAAPISEAPPSEAPASEAPPSEAPPSEAPPSEAPPSEAPASAAPVTEPPATDVDWPSPPTAPQVALVDIGPAGDRRLYAARTEVTNATWAAVMGDGPSDERPATRKTYAEVVRFLNALSKREGLTPCHVGMDLRDDCTGYRTPTEAEWDRVARRAHPGGPPPASGARYWKHGLKAPNAVCAAGVSNGLCDVYGNVWEWTADGGRKARVRRGGSWMHTRKDASARVRHGVKKRSPYLGVRPVRLAKPQPFVFGGVHVDPLGRAIHAPERPTRTLSPAAANILYDGLRAKGGVVALPELAERAELDLPALRAGADALRTALDELGQALRLAPAGADGVRLILN